MSVAELDPGHSYGKDQEEASFDVGYVVDITRHYLTDIGKVALLTVEQEVALVKGVEAGVYAGRLIAAAQETDFSLDLDTRRDLEAAIQAGKQDKDHLWQSNLRLVVSIAKRYQGQGLELLDLVQEGNLGLRLAIEKFDYTSGLRLATYARWWILQAVTRGLANTGRTVRIPVGVTEQVSKLRRIQRDLMNDLDREPTLSELAREAGCGMHEVGELLTYAQIPYSLSQADYFNSTPGDQALEAELVRGQPSLETEVTRRLDLQELGTALMFVRQMSQDGARFVYVICARWGLFGHEEKTLKAIGEELNLSGKRVGTLERQALHRLYFALNSLGHSLDPSVAPTR